LGYFASEEQILRDISGKHEQKHCVQRLLLSKPSRNVSKTDHFLTENDHFSTTFDHFSATFCPKIPLKQGVILEKEQKVSKRDVIYTSESFPTTVIQRLLLRKAAEK